MPSIRGFGVKIGRFGAQDQRPPGLSRRGRDLYLDEFVEDYIDFKQKDGTVKDIYDHLILGRQVHKRQPRWSLIRNVLHWIN